MKLTPKTLIETHQEEKSWGREFWIENNDEYCGKILFFETAGGQTSLHFHVLKRETMFCSVGSFEIHYVDTQTGTFDMVVLREGDSVEIPRFVPHRIVATEPGSQLFEFSTKHYNEDSYRVIK